MSRIIVLLLFLAFWVENTKCQDLEVYIEAKEAISIADSLFNLKKYEQAIPEYQKLLQQYPQEPLYHYYLGVSYLYGTTNAKKAIEHLQFASTQQVPNKVYFHLAEAYQLNYQFDQAISYFRRFIINGGDPEIPTSMVERRVGQCENGNFMIRFIYQPNVIDKKVIPKTDIHRYIVTKSDKGNFIPLPNNLKTQTDLRLGNNSIIFYPKDPAVGDKIFFSSYGNTTSSGRDIYMIELQSDGYWTKPKNLGNNINTPFDEDFPYLAPDGITLYFASKGHYSMGGFDVYKSVYNPITRQWSTPENLGFPFSSPYDDFLYVPDAKEELVTIITGRNTLVDSVEVVVVEIEENPIRRTFDKIESIWNIAKLDISSATTPPSIASPTPSVEPERKPQTKPATFSAVENDPEYSRVLAQGFREQMLADSLKQRLEKLRERFDYIYTAEDRRALERQVVSVEDALLEAQKNADNFFARASQIEQEYITGRRKPVDNQTTTFVDDNPKFLYQAQFAPTVFQADELKTLERLEQSSTQIETTRRELSAIRSRIQEIEQLQPDSYIENQEYIKLKRDQVPKMRSFNSLLQSHAVGKRNIYRECISVAMVKGGASNNPEIRAIIDLANQNFRSASAIRNNATPETTFQSDYEALQLDELGVLQLELAFAKLWGIKLFEQETLSKIFKLEQNLFGRPITSSLASKSKATIIPAPQVQHESIIRTIENDLETDSILFKPDEKPSFQVVDVSPYNDQNPIPVDEPFPSGVTYRIQLAAFSNPVAIEYFKGMIPVNGERVSGGKVTKYYVGNFKYFSDADKALPVVRSLGFKDAFIVAWHNGRSVSITRAQVLEKEEENKPSGSNVNVNIAQDTKLYMVQIGHFKGRLPDDIAQTVRALSPGKDIVRKPVEGGGFIYSVGSYTGLSEANRVKDNLIGSGISNAFVVAVDLDEE